MLQRAAPETTAFTHGDIVREFRRLIEWAKGGSLYIVTPFLNELDIGRKQDLSAQLHRHARETMDIRLMVAPPYPPHKSTRHKDLGSLLGCCHCRNTAQKIKLLDKYWGFVIDLLVKETLHGKVYLAWNDRGELRCVTGSVNLTSQAFQKWCELGISTSDKVLTEQINRITMRWEGPDRKRGPRAVPYITWKTAFLRTYPHLNTILTHI